MIEPLIFDSIGKEAVFIGIMFVIVFFMMLFFVHPPSFGYIIGSLRNAFPSKEMSIVNNDWQVNVFNITRSNGD